MMIFSPILLPYNWLRLVEKYEITNIKNPTAQNIAKKVKQIILEKKESTIGARKVQVFLNAVINKNFNIYNDFVDIPEFIIDEVFSEIRGEKGLNFCEKLDSIIAELLAFQEILKKEGFVCIQKKRKDGQSDFFIEKDGFIYEAEVKFKMSDQAFHEAITHLIMGYSILPHTHCLNGKKVIVNIKLQPNEITHKNKQRIYKKVEEWCQSNLSNFSDEDIDIMIENGVEKILQIKCGNDIRLSVVPTLDKISETLSSHIQKIKEQFEKREPHKSIGIIIWNTPWNYNFEDKSSQIKDNIQKGVNELLNINRYCCDRLYVYPMGLKENLIFE